MAVPAVPLPPALGTHFSLPGDSLYELAQARPHNVLHFLVIGDAQDKECQPTLK